MIKLKNLIKELTDEPGSIDIYGHWIDSKGKSVDVELSHEKIAIEILKRLVKEWKITKAEYDSLNIPLNSTTEVENMLFVHGWIRGVTDGPDRYFVNGYRGQKFTPEQLRWMKKHGKQTKRTVYWCPAGEGQIIDMKTIYSPYDIMESKTPNSRLGLCYELSGRYVSQNHDSILVHGRLTNPFGKGHPELDHAWVEVGDEIFDPVMDKIWPKNVYEDLFKTKVYKKYTFMELIRIINKTGNWGPWDDVEIKTEGKEKQRGRPLIYTGYKYSSVEVFKPVTTTDNELKKNDCVTRDKNFAIKHAERMTTMYNELYRVMKFIVKSQYVFEAPNQGEYFYNGPDVKGVEV